ncbi:aminotransferase class I/II-fold pyridoxal phosphate-dependent enzyme [Nonomuraea sp. 3N208]|uniref:aminotransferase class I/II-fold pyridoxal phosphate-dependent enzyme n=1 Tax=Nonomuraea sp. 3N208 TaxID=3457421 RepID=UPI003FD2E7B0
MTGPTTTVPPAFRMGGTTPPITAPGPGPGRTWTTDDILVTHGATAALAAVALAMIGPGDRVVIPEPAYSLYADLVVLAGGTVDFVPLAPDLHWDLDALAEALPGAAMMIFSNPSFSKTYAMTDCGWAT